MRTRSPKAILGPLAVGLAAALSTPGCGQDGGLSVEDGGAGADGGGESVTDLAPPPAPDLVAVECTMDSQCADAIDCTADTCTDGKCANTAGPNWGATACGPGQVCDGKTGCVPFSGMIPSNLCAMDPPMGAPVAPKPPKFAGQCPKIVAWPAAKNQIVSSGANREFLVAVPANLDPNERLPVIFLWHWLGASAKSFYEKGQVQAAVDGQRFLAIIPESKGDLFKWPFDITTSQARMDEEFRFFDDLLACAAEQFNVNENCVSSAGVSAGALFTDQLVAARSDRLASGISLSGGVGDTSRPWGKPPRKLPMLVLWGGPKDACFVVQNFEKQSKTLEAALVADGHFFVECQHNCGHAEPPIEAALGLSRYGSLWKFAFDHPFWLTPGDSPYKATTLPPEYPPWCAMGPASATPRTGECPDKPGC